jgi:hypothetical protein
LIVWGPSEAREPPDGQNNNQRDDENATGRDSGLEAAEERIEIRLKTGRKRQDPETKSVVVSAREAGDVAPAAVAVNPLRGSGLRPLTAILVGCDLAGVFA